jgi:hypothetical protein
LGLSRYRNNINDYLELKNRFERDEWCQGPGPQAIEKDGEEPAIKEIGYLLEISSTSNMAQQLTICFGA